MKKTWKKTETFEQRFMKYISIDQKSGCWIWTGNLDFYGYGRFCYKRKSYRSSRAAFLIFKNIDPKKLNACHKCDNPACANPDHLFLGTQKQNMEDCFLKKRTAYGQKNGMSKLKEEDIPNIFKLAKEGYLHREIAEKYNVSRSAIGSILNKVRWTQHGGSYRLHSNNIHIQQLDHG